MNAPAQVHTRRTLAERLDRLRRHANTLRYLCGIAAGIDAVVGRSPLREDPNTTEVRVYVAPLVILANRLSDLASIEAEDLEPATYRAPDGPAAQDHAWLHRHLSAVGERLDLLHSLFLAVMADDWTVTDAGSSVHALASCAHYLIDIENRAADCERADAADAVYALCAAETPTDFAPTEPATKITGDEA